MPRSDPLLKMRVAEERLALEVPSTMDNWAKIFNEFETVCNENRVVRVLPRRNYDGEEEV